MSQLTDFYRELGTDARGRTLGDLWAFSLEELEGVHDFIQWVFPLAEASQYNPDAPILTASDRAAFREHSELRSNLRRSFEVFLAFLGLKWESGRVVETADWADRSGVWRHPNHNWLRITRVLTSLRLLGLEAESRAFFLYLQGLRHSGRSGITDARFSFWERASPSDGDPAV